MASHDAQRAIGWIASYALGVAWAGLPPHEVYADIISAARGDVGVVAQALHLATGIESSDPRATARARELLIQTLNLMTGRGRASA